MEKINETIQIDPKAGTVTGTIEEIPQSLADRLTVYLLSSDRTRVIAVLDRGYFRRGVNPDGESETLGEAA